MKFEKYIIWSTRKSECAEKTITTTAAKNDGIYFLLLFCIVYIHMFEGWKIVAMKRKENIAHIREKNHNDHKIRLTKRDSLALPTKNRAWELWEATAQSSAIWPNGESMLANVRKLKLQEWMIETYKHVDVDVKWTNSVNARAQCAHKRKKHEWRER